MPDFSVRSSQKELLDEEGIPFEDLRQNLRELEFINTWLGGHAVTVGALANLMTDKTRPYVLMDIGSGGGDTLRFIARWAQSKGYQVRLIGVDYKQEAIDYAASQSLDYSNIDYVLLDYRQMEDLEEKPDIIISSLFCHHLSDVELVDYLRLMHRNARVGWVINDLHRHFLAYYSIKWLAALFSKSYLLRHDAPLSVWRGFGQKDWQRYFEAAGLVHAQLCWKWAFRWRVICRNAG